MPTLIFPAGTLFPMPNGCYYRTPAGEIVLTCSRDELAAALAVANAIGIQSPRTATAAETETDRILRSIAQPGDKWIVRQ